MGTWSRRRVLGSSAGTALAAALGTAGCDSDPAPPPPPDPHQPVLDEAVALALAYDRLAAAQPALAPRLAPLAADHRAHAAELTRVIGSAVPPSGSPAPAAGAATVADLRKAEQQAQRNADAAARTAPAGRAALLGSIAACRACHAEALR